MIPAYACHVCGKIGPAPYCPDHTPDHRSPSSRRTSTYAWQKRIRPFILRRDNYRCHWCGIDLLTLRPHQRQVDHLDAVSHQGTDDPARLVASCGPCNNQRGNR